MDMRKLMAANERGLRESLEGVGDPMTATVGSPITSALNVETAAVLTTIHGDPSAWKKYENAVRKYRKEAAGDVAVQAGQVTPDQHVILSIARDLRAEYGDASGKGVHTAVLSAALHEVDWEAVARDVVTDASVMPVEGTASGPAGEETEAADDGDDAPEFGSDEDGDEDEVEFGSDDATEADEGDDDEADDAPEFGSDEDEEPKDED